MEVCRQRAKPGGQPGRGWPRGPCGEAVRGGVCKQGAATAAGDRAGGWHRPGRLPEACPSDPASGSRGHGAWRFLVIAELSLRFLRLTFHLLVTPSQAPISSDNRPEATGALGVAVCPSLTLGSTLPPSPQAWPASPRGRSRHLLPRLPVLCTSAC